MLIFDHNGAKWSANKEHDHLFANDVMPHLQGTTRRLQKNEEWTRSVREELTASSWKAIEDVSTKHADEVAAKEAARGPVSH